MLYLRLFLGTTDRKDICSKNSGSWGRIDKPPNGSILTHNLPALLEHASNKSNTNAGRGCSMSTNPFETTLIPLSTPRFAIFGDRVGCQGGIGSHPGYRNSPVDRRYAPSDNRLHRKRDNRWYQLFRNGNRYGGSNASRAQHSAEIRLGLSFTVLPGSPGIVHGMPRFLSCTLQPLIGALVSSIEAGVFCMLRLRGTR